MRSASFLLFALLCSAAPGCGYVGGEDDGPVTVQGVTLLRHHGGDAYPAGQGIGALVVHDGCVALAGTSGPPSFVLWPPGYDLRGQGEGYEVVTDGGGVVARIGDDVVLGGGYGALDWADDVTGGSVPERCRDAGVERYFLAAP